LKLLPQNNEIDNQDDDRHQHSSIMPRLEPRLEIV